MTGLLAPLLAPLLALAMLQLAAGPAAETPTAVAVLDHGVEKGDLLGAGDLVSADMAPGLARGALPMREIAGMEAARKLPAGAMLRSSDVIRPQLVRRGEPVTISLRDGGLVITSAGRALASAAAGEPVRVVSLATNHTLDATVEGSGAVRIVAR